MQFRIEKDTMGPVEVPSEKFWGAQTQRSINNFKIGGPRNQMPLEIIHAFAIVKKSAADANAGLGGLDKEKPASRSEVCNERLEGTWDEQFPLVSWPTGA